MAKGTGQHQFNPWKWAFFLLLIIILGGVGYGWHQVTVPSSTTTKIGSTPTKTDASFYVSLNRTQVNALTNSYLTKLQRGQRVKYRFIVGDRYATVSGKAKLLNVPVQFAVNLVPERLSNGNVLLHAKGMEVGRLNLPMKFVLGFLAKTYKLPKWVTINPQRKTILLDLAKYSRGRTMHYSADEINMASGHFRFLISIPKP